MNDALTHLNTQGQAHMVDVSEKKATVRTATAQCTLHLSPRAHAALQNNPKGDVFATARIAGIQAAKKTPELIPLCHSLQLKKVGIHFNVSPEYIIIRAEAKVLDVTGVEMEALTAASIAALTLYDMLKAVDKSLRISDLHLVEKTGGKSGDFKAGR